VASFIILAFFWIQLDLLPGFIAFLMVVPMVWANVSEGIRQTDSGLLEMARVYRLGFWKTLWHIWIPSVRPFFLTACTTGLAFAWKSGIAAEVICNPNLAIGSRLGDAKAYLEMPEVFAWTAMVVVLSVLLERVLRWLVHRKQEVKV
jgi:NitT/TauT family transport system permease protein